MAKLIGPLLSEAAHGRLTNALTFSRRSSGNQVRYQRPQKDYTNTARETQRELFKTAIAWWLEMTPTEKKEFDGYDKRDP